MINSLFEVKTQDRLACVTEQILLGGAGVGGDPSVAGALGKTSRGRWVSRCVCVAVESVLNPPFIGNMGGQQRRVC